MATKVLVEAEEDEGAKLRKVRPAIPETWMSTEAKVVRGQPSEGWQLKRQQPRNQLPRPWCPDLPG